MILYVGKTSAGDAWAQSSAAKACVAASALDLEGEAPAPLALSLEGEGSEGIAPAPLCPAFHFEGAFPFPCEGEDAESAVPVFLWKAKVRKAPAHARTGKVKKVKLWKIPPRHRSREGAFAAGQRPALGRTPA